MTRWNQGRSTVDALIGSSELERVPASQLAAEAELVRARMHVGSARQLLATAPEGAYRLAYDAARRALAAVLQNQGLGATSRRGQTVSARPCEHSSIRRSGPCCVPSTACEPGPTKSVVGGPHCDAGGGCGRLDEGGGAHRARGEGDPEHAALLESLGWPRVDRR